MPDRLIRRLDGPRGGGLFALGGLGVIHGLAYLPVTGARLDVLPTGLQIIGDVVPVSGYGGAWFAVGGMALWASFTDHDGMRRRHQHWGFSWVFGLSLAWSFAYLLGCALSIKAGAMDRQWIAGCYYLCLALVTVALSRCRNPFVIDLRREGRRRKQHGPR